MEEKQNKLFEIIKTIFVPKYMTRLTGIAAIVSIIILFFSSLICIFSSKVSASTLAANDLSIPTVVYEVSTEFTIDSEADPLPILSINEDDGFIDSTKNGIYSNTYIKDDKNVEITIVIDTEENNPLASSFIDNYFHRTKADDTTYALFIITREYIYHSFNFTLNSEYDSVHFVKDDNGYKYYLPASADEIAANSYGDVDTTLWTKEAVSTDVSEFKFNNQELKATTRFNDNLLYALYGNFSSVIRLSAVSFDITTLNTSFAKFVKSFSSAFITNNENSYSAVVLILSLIFNFVFPFILALIGWIISHKMYLTKYREYLALAAICFLDVSIVAAIVGFFVHYSKTFFIFLTLASVFFVVASIIINKPDKKEKKKKEEKTITKPTDHAELG